jgi:hypothetical protein
MSIAKLKARKKRLNDNSEMMIISILYTGVIEGQTQESILASNLGKT